MSECARDFIIHLHAIYIFIYLLFLAQLNITPDDPRWIGAWWGGFLICGALLFFSALFMFGFPQSLPSKEMEGVLESEQAMLPASLPQDYEKSKPSNGVLQNYQPNSNSLSCCQQLRGLSANTSTHTLTKLLNTSNPQNLRPPMSRCDVSY